MNEFIIKVIHNLLTFKRASTNETKIFETLKHNKNLCPDFQKQIEGILSTFLKYKRIVYDVQGIWDEGTDVLLRESKEEINYFLCFQIKSHDDFKKSSLIKDLKAQYFDTKKQYSELIRYYIVCCCNLTDHNLDKIRNIEAEFSKEKDVFVIDPEHSLTFLRLSIMQIDALIKRSLEDEDQVFEQTRKLIVDLTPTERGILYYIIYTRLFHDMDSLSIEDLENSTFLGRIYDVVPDKDREWFFLDTDDEYYEDGDEIFRDRDISLKERVSYDLENLHGNVLEWEEAGTIHIDLKEFLPIVIQMCDGYLRYDYKNDDLLFYMLELLGEQKGFDITQIKNHG